MLSWIFQDPFAASRAVYKDGDFKRPSQMQWHCCLSLFLKLSQIITELSTNTLVLLQVSNLITCLHGNLQVRPIVNLPEVYFTASSEARVLQGLSNNIQSLEGIDLNCARGGVSYLVVVWWLVWFGASDLTTQ